MKRLHLTLWSVGLLLFAQAAQADWTPAKRITWASGNSFHPAVAVDSSGNPHVVWYNENLGQYAVYYKKSTDGGATWTPGKRLTSTSGYCPAIAVDSSNNLHVVFHYDKPGNDEIYYKKSADGGGTWSPNRRLTWNSGSSWAPAVVVDPSDFLHVVCYDDSPGNDEIYYLSSADGGITWTSSQRLTWNSGWSRQPSIAASSSGDLHVVWYDKTTGKCEIFYKEGN